MRSLTTEETMFKKLVSTSNDVALTMLRLVLGVVFFAHGAQKLLGWFGGPGFSGTMGMFTGYLHIPAPLAFLAIATVHHSYGFFMNWAGTQKGEGFEYHLLVLAITAYLIIRGAGALSVDRAIAAKPRLARA